MGVAVSIDNLSKRFRLFDQRFNSFKERALHFGKVPSHSFWALKDVNFDIEEGSTTGLLGKNGSGKSTLLKCIAGILTPTEGRVIVRGRLASMLELGAGFHPDLSGRDNVYLNASLLGFSKKDIDKRFDEIVEFSELSEFIDSQVKHYSSGMYTRLGFAVAVNVDPDILLVDEVLAVGDEAFQLKCIDRIRAFQNDGRTIVLVTHSADQVRQICDKAVVLKRGEVISAGSTGDAIRTYRDDLLADSASEEVAIDADIEASSTENESIPIKVVEPKKALVELAPAVFTFGDSEDGRFLIAGGALKISVPYETDLELIEGVVQMSIYDSKENLMFETSTIDLGQGDVHFPPQGSIEIEFDSVPLLDGSYRLGIGVRDKSGHMLGWRDLIDHFEVMNPTKSSGLLKLDPQIIVKNK